MICGGVAIIAEVSESAVEKRLKQGWVTAASPDLSTCLKLAKEALSKGHPASIAYIGNVVDLWERLASDTSANEPLIPSLGSDQTSCHLRKIILPFLFASKIKWMQQLFRGVTFLLAIHSRRQRN